MTERKPHKQISQSEYLRAMKFVELDEVHIVDIAEFLDVSVSTARRKLDGLVVQGEVVKIKPGIYALR